MLDTSLTESQRQCLATVKSAADNLLGLINELLDFAKIEAGKLELDNAPFALRQMLSDTLRALAVRAHRKGLELVSHVDDQVADALIGDAGRLRQILLNVVGNAIKFTTYGEVVVRVDALRDAPCRLRFTVCDTGIGIPPEKHETIFRAFEQEDCSTTRRYGGTGLGLTISMRLAQLMGGTIEVDSRPGHGSTFTILVDLQRQIGAPASTSISLRDLKVLVVDDNATNRHILLEWLRGWRVEAVTAGDGISALDALWEAANEGNPYDLTLLDARMPDTDGITLAGTIRRRRELAATRIVLLTSGDRPGDWQRARELHVNAYMLKPVQQQELLEVIQRVMSEPREAAETTPSESARVREAAPARGAGEPSLRILVAEDNELNAQLLESLLVKRGHRVHLVGDGRQALERATTGAWDVLLLDIHMPELDGFQVAQAIRAHERGGVRRLPILALTARARADDHERCRAAGIDQCLIKPFAAEVLWAALRQAAPAPAAHAESPLDEELLLAACGSDNDTLAALCQAFSENMPGQMSLLARLVRQRDLPAVRELAHKLCGIVAAFSSQAGTLAAQLEEAAAEGHATASEALAGQLDAHVRRMLEALPRVSTEGLGYGTQE